MARRPSIRIWWPTRSRVCYELLAVGTLGYLLAVVVTPANEQERAQVAELAKAVQEVTGSRRSRVRGESLG